MGMTRVHECIVSNSRIFAEVSSRELWYLLVPATKVDLLVADLLMYALSTNNWYGLKNIWVGLLSHQKADQDVMSTR